ncbi:RagB/SusD family nutrient uptake outer membrane protein [Parapedobacter deserti]|uniref:RagB/SusD family nutrient uptake outer membrane protein n=1 Tax=Parapedobacter deserti TaxID=1912957 RepID=A0ABV7JTC4_9SPHI
MNKTRNYLTFFAFLTVALQGCEKDWLAAKNNLNRVVPVTLADARAILRSSTLLNIGNDQIGMSLLASDDLYLQTATYLSRSEKERNIYVWSPAIDSRSTPIAEWNDGYEQVLYANVALETVAGVERNAANAMEHDEVRGAALFFRAKAFYNLLQLFAPAWDPDKDNSRAGIPLRLSSDPNPKTMRASVSDGYRQVMDDLSMASQLLTTRPALKTDPSKQAAFGLLARCLLGMADYRGAVLYADSALQLESALLDYNALLDRTSMQYPFEPQHEEVIFDAIIGPNYVPVRFNYCMVDSTLFAGYRDDDLRKQLFFAVNSQGGPSFRGSYSGADNRFSGIATDELFLIRAECSARLGNIDDALEDINTLLAHRMDRSSFVPYGESDQKKLLDRILVERRKELVFRGQRWTDLRRLNAEPARAVTLVREIDGSNYRLPPESSRYVFPIPEYVIDETGLTQNDRRDD